MTTCDHRFTIRTLAAGTCTDAVEGAPVDLQEVAKALAPLLLKSAEEVASGLVGVVSFYD